MNCNRDDEQTHVHEFLGSTRIVEDDNCEFHNHRLAGVTGEAIPINNGRNHYHNINTRTDFFEDHFHEVNVRTGPAIRVGNGRHVHFVYATTRTRDGHRHNFILATLIENPIGEDEDC